MGAKILKDDGRQIPVTWPESLKHQLEISNSHVSIIEKIGIPRATIGIFETLSMVKIPDGFLPIMKKIGDKGNDELESEMICYEGQSKELSNYSYVATVLALKLLTGYEKTPKNVRKIIRICTGEVLTHTHLLEDIQKAAVKMARPLSVSPTKIAITTKTFNRFVIDERKIDYMSDRPIDWETSHWWSGE